MTRIATAVLLAAPLFLGVDAGTASANNGPCTFGLGCGGNCLRLFPRIHQHGPLFNYGPYYGYPPFEPYGYWNSYLQYTGPMPDPVYGWGNPGQGSYGWIHGPRPATFGHGFPHPLHNGGGLLHHGGGILHHKGSGGCSTCGTAAENYVNAGNALDRYTGRGDPAASQAYYADSPATILTAGFTGR